MQLGYSLSHLNLNVKYSIFKDRIFKTGFDSHKLFYVFDLKGINCCYKYINLSIYDLHFFHATNLTEFTVIDFILYLYFRFLYME